LTRKITYATGHNRRPGFNLAVHLEMCLRKAVILMTFWVGIDAYSGTIQQQADTPTVPNVSRQEHLEDRISSAPEGVLKRFSNELNVNVSAYSHA
jgi:hypothetical protein